MENPQKEAEVLRETAYTLGGVAGLTAAAYRYELVAIDAYSTPNPTPPQQWRMAVAVPKSRAAKEAQEYVKSLPTLRRKSKVNMKSLRRRETLVKIFEPGRTVPTPASSKREILERPMLSIADLGNSMMTSSIFDV